MISDVLSIYTNMTAIKKIGFACKMSEMHREKGVISIPEYNSQVTTAAWMSRQTHSVAEDRLWSMLTHNIEAARKLVGKVGTWDEQHRMVRISSDLCPLRTHSDWRYFYRQPDVVRYMEKHFKVVGDTAKRYNVRVSFHPGQFTCIVSNNPGIVNSSIEELEYHTDMLRMMGYGNTLLDAKVNIHLSGNLGVDGFDTAWHRMSPELRNMLTLENDEFQAGLDVVLKLKHKAGIVLDLHHHWINTGEYIEADDSRIQMVIESWCRDGIDRRPTFHYSQSHESVLIGHSITSRPSLNQLINTGYKKSKLRAHSNFMWNEAVNKWAYTHWKWGDVMVEAKSKNLGSEQLLATWKQNQ